MRHVIILGGVAHQDSDPLPEKTEGVEFWAQNPIEQWVTPETDWNDSGDGYVETRTADMLSDVVDRWYEMHEEHVTALLHPVHLGWLSAFGGTIYAQNENQWGLVTERYPLEDVQALTPRGNYLAGSFSYMVAHAILEGVDKIGFHWMAKAVVRSPSEPRDAQTSLEYWLGVAEGRGVEIDTGNLWLLRTWWGGRYGYDGMPPEWHRERDYEVHWADEQYGEYIMGDRWNKTRID